MREETPEKKLNPALEIGLWPFPRTAEVPTMAVPPENPCRQWDVKHHRPKPSRREDLCQEIHHKTEDDHSKRLGDHGNLRMVRTAVQPVSHPSEKQGAQHGGRERMADAAVKGQVVQFI